MDRRTLILSGMAASLGGCASTGSAGYQEAGGSPLRTYSSDEIVNATSDFLGVTAEAAGSAIERIFRDNGQPTGYIAGEEASGAMTIGARYGRGLLYMKERETMEVFWQGPSIGFDVGGEGARVMMLVYNLPAVDALWNRYVGVSGSAYFVGGLGMTAVTWDRVVIVPIRSGVGLRLGANVGYLKFTPQSTWNPL